MCNRPHFIKSRVNTNGLYIIIDIDWKHQEVTYKVNDSSYHTEKFSDIEFMLDDDTEVITMLETEKYLSY